MALGGEASNLRKELNKPPSGEKWEIYADAFIYGPIIGGILALIICLILHWTVMNPEYSTAFVLHLCPCDWAIFTICALAGVGFFLGDIVPNQNSNLKISIIIAACIMAIGGAIIVQTGLWHSEMENYEEIKALIEEVKNEPYYSAPFVQEELDREVQDGVIYDDSYENYEFDNDGAPY